MMLNLPLSVPVKGETFTLNLNKYRNAHFRVLAAAKENYTAIVTDLVQLQPRCRFEKAELEYVYFHPSNRRVDVSNPCSVIDKFTCDALVKCGVISDDNCLIIPTIRYSFGGVDKNNPRCELLIKEM